MKINRIGISVVMFLITTVPFAIPEELRKEVLVPKIAIPLSGTKTTFRFMVKNEGSSPSIVDAPFVNRTRLVVIYPDGKKHERGIWKEMERVPDPLRPGDSFQWDVDIGRKIEFKEKGEYTISFTVKGQESNKIIVIKDD